MDERHLAQFDRSTTDTLRRLLAEKHAELAQSHLPPKERTTTARNYDSAIKALGDYMAQVGVALPSKGLLRRWRDDMLAGRHLNSEREGGLAVATVNARLAAARKLLRGVADDIADLTLKITLRDWAGVEDAKATAMQDKFDEDYGLRLSQSELQSYLQSIPSKHLKGLRDRALVALMAGAGLRLSEVTALTLRDVFLAIDSATRVRGIRVRRGKFNKSRIVILGDGNNWVYQMVQRYTDALGLNPHSHPDQRLFYGMRRRKDGNYNSTGKALSVRGVQRAVEAYPAFYRGQLVSLMAHDLRRTYAKLCRQSGMSWDAIRQNMGHSSVVVTETYVGHDVDYAERIPKWHIELSD